MSIKPCLNADIVFEHPFRLPCSTANYSLYILSLLLSPSIHLSPHTAPDTMFALQRCLHSLWLKGTDQCMKMKGKIHEWEGSRWQQSVCICSGRDRGERWADIANIELSYWLTGSDEWNCTDLNEDHMSQGIRAWNSTGMTGEGKWDRGRSLSIYLSILES